MPNKDSVTNNAKDQTSTDSGRRRFIAGLTAVGGLAAAGAAVSANNDAPTPATTPETGEPTESIGYQNSDHVQAYYRSLKD